MKINPFASFEEASQSVQGTKHMIVSKYRPYLESVLGIEDLMATADIGIFEAYRTWDPEKSKFNTHAYNHIEWKVKDELNLMNSRFKVNSITNSELAYENETYAKIKSIGKTQDDEFNKLHHLDGSDISKKRFNRIMFNQYVVFQSSNRRPIYMINESQFTNPNSEEFNIFDTVGDIDDHTEFEMRSDLKSLKPLNRKIAEMLLDGATLAEVSKTVKISQVKLLKTFAPKEKLFI